MKRVFFLLFLGLMGFFSPQGEAMRLDPESHAMLSDPKYAKHIEVQCYLVTREQIGELFSKKNVTISQLNNSELPLDDVYLLVRCKNRGDYRAFGTLNCFIPNRGDPIPISIVMMHAYTNSFQDYIIHINYGANRQNKNIPQIRYEWDCLYTM